MTGIFVVVFVHYCYLPEENGSAVRYVRTPAHHSLTRVISDTPTTSHVTGRPCQYPDEVDLRVIVITFNRPYSLLKLLRSLDTLVLDDNRAALEIWIDRHRKKGVDQRTLEVASAFKWKGGPTRVHVQVALKFFVLILEQLYCSITLLYVSISFRYLKDSSFWKCKVYADTRRGSYWLGP